MHLLTKNKMKILLLIASLVACTLGAPKPIDNRITNGEDAEAGQFPYQISLEWGLFGIYQHICGGSIISPNFILTAGHCVTELPIAGDMRIKAGILTLDQAGSDRQMINVVERIVHPDYNGGVNPNDIALLRLESALKMTDVVKAIALPIAGDVATGESIISGWGSTSTNNFPIMPNHLQTTTLPLISIKECGDLLTALLGTSEPLAEGNVCTGPLNGKSACSGDSGGPLAQNGKVIGVVSWGIVPCGTAGAPSVFTQTSSFIDFIKEHVDDLPSA